MDKVDIIIVNWNAGNQLFDCVKSVLQYGKLLVDRIVVVDNGSSDMSENAVESFPQVTLIRAGANLGFAKACNLGASHANSEFLLFLNPDATLYPNSLPEVLSYMQQPQNIFVGICGIQLIDECGHIARNCAHFPSLGSLVSHAFGIDRLIPELGHFMTGWDHAITRQVDQVIGAFFLVRRSVFVELQGFDERYFVYFEEVDFSYRAKQHGWDSVYLADVQAFHSGGGTSEQVKAHRLFYSLRSRILYSFKHFNFFEAIIILLSTMIIELLSRSIYAVVRRSWQTLKETWAAYGMLVRWLPNWLIKGSTR